MFCVIVFYTQVFRGLCHENWVIRCTELHHQVQDILDWGTEKNNFLDLCGSQD